MLVTLRPIITLMYYNYNPAQPYFMDAQLFSMVVNTLAQNDDKKNGTRDNEGNCKYLQYPCSQAPHS